MTCLECQTDFVPKIQSEKRAFLYCSKKCRKLFQRRRWRTRHKEKHCSSCQATFDGKPDSGTLCPSCLTLSRRRIRVQRATHPCIQCGAPISGSRKTCSRACKGKRQSAVLTGRNYYQPSRLVHNLTCARCHSAFTLRRKRQESGVCCKCQRQLSTKGRGKHERRAKLANVPYVYGIKALQVFERDGWRCHICGSPTPKRLKGLQLPKSPEVDHIVPLARGGGHTWDNVACSCHECNMKKRDKPLGQLRLAI